LDNKKLISIDSITYQPKYKGDFTLDHACYTFTPLHIDPQNYVIMGCEKGTLVILDMNRRIISKSFDMDDALIA